MKVLKEFIGKSMEESLNLKDIFGGISKTNFKRMPELTSDVWELLGKTQINKLKQTYGDIYFNITRNFQRNLKKNASEKCLISIPEEKS